MSVNRHKPHIMVLPEDDANRQMAIGFERLVGTRQFQVLSPAGGWPKLGPKFQSAHIPEMRAIPSRFMVLLVDFDHARVRYDQIAKSVPADLVSRVFILGVWTDPEDLKRGRTLESIGKDLATACECDVSGEWDDPLLRHNAPELERLRTTAHPILFEGSD